MMELFYRKMQLLWAFYKGGCNSYGAFLQEDETNTCKKVFHVQFASFENLEISNPAKELFNGSKWLQTDNLINKD